MSSTSSATPQGGSRSGATLLRGWIEEIDRQLASEGRHEASKPGLPGSGEGRVSLEDAAGEASLGATDEGTLHVIFQLSGSAFAVPAASLAEVKVFAPPMPIPGVPSWVLGIESFHGETLSVTDLAAFLGFSSLTRSDAARTVVVFDPRSPRRALTGLAVDAVSTHEWLPDRGGHVDAAKGLSGRLGRFTQRIVEVGGRALAVLDLDALLRSEEFLHLST